MVDEERYAVRSSDTLRRAAALIDRNKTGIVLVLDHEHRLLGTITDGDLRRAMLRGDSLDTLVADVLAVPRPAPVTAPQDADRHTLLHLMQERRVRQVPLLDSDQRVVDLVLLDQLVDSPPLPVTAVLMAGGLGTRLRPLTDHVPKPLLPVGGKPLIERAVDNLRASGVRKVIVTTHYLGSAIADHLGNGCDHHVAIEYVHEEDPLGTAGALSLIESTDTPLLVVNGDILTQLDYGALFAFHQEHGADMTVTAREYHLEVPYGVLQTDGVHLRSIVEKPDYRFFVAGGVYLLNADVLKFLVTREHCDMPTLIARLVEAGRTVVTFPIREYWLDIGHLDAYEQANADHAEFRAQ
jgi:dTDP-glucose pyrophosphorylase/CBS domain-containing protein